MVGTIFPVGYGDRTKYAVIVIHSIGYVIGAVLLGVLSVMLGKLFRMFLPWLIPAPRMFLALLGVTAVLLGARHLRLCHVPFPQSFWQVPASWRNRFGMRSMALAYAVVLGFGLLTRFPPSASIAMLWAILNSKAIVSGAVLCGFGLGRGIPLIVGWKLLTKRSPEEMTHLISASTAAGIVISGLLLSAVGALLVGMAI
jgi:hypothetical protein